jgi:hypothetical protein
MLLASAYQIVLGAVRMMGARLAVADGIQDLHDIQLESAFPRA